jgi:hypothetical protein
VVAEPEPETVLDGELGALGGGGRGPGATEADVTEGAPLP